ncbi:MAG: hypothetical protein EP313_00155 [Bacteroidetes bacterium]|nr:MAG: hypothetical protein EP313_00155 [Bacteroidota bacterium]
MKGRLILTCCLLQLSLLSGYGAENGKDFIIKITKDTVFGKAEILSDIEYRTSIPFYDEKGEKTRYSPEEVQAFYIGEDNRYFESKTIMMNGESVKVFLRCLVKGETSLYLLRDFEEPTLSFYYQRKDYFATLDNTKTVKNIDGRLYNVYNYEYIATLKNELVDICPGLLGSVDEVKYSEKELASFIEKVNKCLSPEIPSNTYMANNRFEFRTGIITGAGLDRYYPAKGTSFGVGFYQEVKLPETSRALFLSYGLELGYGLTVKDTLNNRWSYQKVSVPILINYEFGGQKITTYILAGVNFLHYLDLNKKTRESPTEGITGGTVYPLTIGCGAKTKRLNLIFTSNIFDTRLKLGYYFK